MSLTNQQLKFFADYVERELGIVYSEQVYFQLEQRLEKVAAYLGLTGVEALAEKALKEGIIGDFKSFFLDIATNNETSFFRDHKVFNVIEKTLLPLLRTAFPMAFSYKIWCTAASFGQEPYSMAMLVHELLKANPGHPRIEVLATDISDQALKRCREAKYSQLEVQRGLSALRTSHYFTKDAEGNWLLKPEIKNVVDFRRQNLLDPFVGIGPFHMILCRYVLIYQDAQRKKAIMQKLERALLPGGHLILGASESALGLATQLEQVAHDGAIVYRKKPEK